MHTQNLYKMGAVQQIIRTCSVHDKIVSIQEEHEGKRKRSIITEAGNC